jgi:RNA-binding protein 39
MTFGTSFPPLSTGLAIPPGVDVDSHPDASIPYHRLYISGLAFSLSSDDIRAVFEAFGQIDFVDLHKDFVSLSQMHLIALITVRLVIRKGRLMSNLKS